MFRGKSVLVVCLTNLLNAQPRVTVGSCAYRSSLFYSEAASDLWETAFSSCESRPRKGKRVSGDSVG